MSSDEKMQISSQPINPRSEDVSNLDVTERDVSDGHISIVVEILKLARLVISLYSISLL
jgi:hypothetical protein